MVLPVGMRIESLMERSIDLDASASAQGMISACVVFFNWRKSCPSQSLSMSVLYVLTGASLARVRVSPARRLRRGAFFRKPAAKTV
jgi:hypothetical protein